MTADATTAVSAGIAVNRGAIKGARTLAAATAGTPGVGIQLLVSVSGTVTLTLYDGSTINVNPLSGQDNIYPFSVTQWSTGTATVTTAWILF